MRARQKRLFAKTLGLSQVRPWQTSDRLSDQVQVWNAHLSNFELVDIRVEEMVGCGNCCYLVLGGTVLAILASVHRGQEASCLLVVSG